jgi:hypothetical protein
MSLADDLAEFRDSLVEVTAEERVRRLKKIIACENMNDAGHRCIYDLCNAFLDGNRLAWNWLMRLSHALDERDTFPSGEFAQAADRWVNDVINHAFTFLRAA